MAYLPLYTPNIGLSLYGIDEVIIENFSLIDKAYGAGSSLNVNGSLVTSPNFSSTTPPAPAGDELITWQVDSNGNISGYVPTPAAGGVTSITGDSVIYNNLLSAGAVTLSLIAQTANTVLAGPSSGAAHIPTFRALVATDIPALPYLPLGTVLPATTTRTAHSFFSSYNAATGSARSFLPTLALIPLYAMFG